MIPDAAAPKSVPDKMRGSDNATAIRAMLIRLDSLRADGRAK